MSDMVNHPDHYQSNGMEVIDVIEAFAGDLYGIEAFDTGNIIKYICRWKSKGGLMDLEKAQWYLNHLIEHKKKEEQKMISVPDDIKFVTSTITLYQEKEND